LIQGGGEVVQRKRRGGGGNLFFIEKKKKPLRGEFTGREAAGLKIIGESKREKEEEGFKNGFVEGVTGMIINAPEEIM